MVERPSTAAPWYYYPEVLDRFRKDTDRHEMEILRDDGLYRHIVFSQPQHRWLYRYELVTWPGHLVIQGDMGTYVFARMEDMFEFFDGPHINAGYWGEKLQAHSRYREYSEERVRMLIRQHFDDRKGRLRPWADSIWDAVEEEVLAEDVIPYQDLVREALSDFSHPSGYEFVNVWEMDFTDYTVQYLWCCHAIQQGIKWYRALQ